jgi:Skp family chaperone for outer membrane proteins
MINRSYLLTAVLILAASVVSVSAQAGPTRFGWINTSAFSDEKGGIVRYVTAVKSVENEFKPKVTELQTLQNRISAIVTELQNAPPGNVASQQALQAKREEGERLRREFGFKKEEFDAAYNKRRGEVVGPISADILKSIQDYGKQKGFAVILDISTMAQGNALLHLDPTADVTKDFVAFYNARPPAAAAVNPVKK